MLFNTILGIVTCAVADGAPSESTRKQVAGGIAGICLLNTISGAIRGDKD